ncbi:MAG: hypothetical protein DMF10_02680 [Verrucomicrobia bacterium]|nr:MAG: hypothetical protein DMF10_02680 [Verrucomicrobiota bacterium]
MTIEGLGKKFQEARRARNLTLDEAARMTKIRPARLAEIEADDFSQFPSLAYSYLQENRPEKPVSAPVVPRRPRRPAAVGRGDRVSPMPFIVGIVVLVFGFLLMKLVLNVQRLAPGRGGPTAQTSPSALPVSPAATQASQSNVAAAPSVAKTTAPAPTTAPNPVVAAGVIPREPEVRRAKPVTREELAKAEETPSTSPGESSDQNRVAIHPLKRTYVRVTVGDENGKPAFERWVSPTDGAVEFHGKHVSIRVLDPDAVKITKNGQALEEGDQDVTVN